jgi:hypothetical protein
VVRPAEHLAEVSFGDEAVIVEYGVPFSPRARSLTPGHLVAVTVTPGPRSLILWRWYDAVVLEQSAEHVRLWEPGHGEVLARPRDPQRRYPVGTRAYASAGLPGADWWVEGPVGAVDTADVALEEVCEFYDEHDLWSRLT